MTFYRAICSFLLRFLGGVFVGRARMESTERAMQAFAQAPGRAALGATYWFHAASVGELESLWPLVERAAKSPQTRLVLTVFSSSAFDHLHRSARKLEGAPPLFVGYSPLEGQWAKALSDTRPDLFVTAKYEAWPEMWDALARQGIPLAIIGAKPRSSLIWARRILRLFSGRIPEILFFSFDAENSPGLRRQFPHAQIHLGSDPRWDRVFQRREVSPKRVFELREEFRDLPRPWGVVGSAWATDIAALPSNASEAVPGTLWVVPHKTDARSVSEIEILLRDRGYTPIRTATPDLVRPAGKLAVLVDEMGFLAELYQIMDWAFIGGGFGSSIHSTIEPAIYGLPIYGGARGQEKFDEISILRKQGQLKLFGDQKTKGLTSRASLDFTQWLHAETSGSKREGEESLESSPSADTVSSRWRRLNEAHRGASDRIWSILNERAERSPRG